ncbi:MAG: NAD(P)-binding protein [Actinomycetia bacterium]|nr:NAD(P)-binding protein [Actinomycetes bacterium]
MTPLPRDIADLPDLATTDFRAGPVRSQRPVYVDLLPPCNAACPAGENCQEWLRLSKELDPQAAWRQLVRDNPFPAIHGRACYHPCEAACNRGDLDSPIGIHAVERYLGDMALEKGWEFEHPRNNTGFKVLVVGAGPAGLSCAYHLTRLGYEVVVRDSAAKAGGMMTYGIPEYRLPRDIVDAEIARLVRMGVTLELSTKVDDLLAAQKEGGFDACFVAVGAGRSRHIDIPSMDADRMIDAVSFLRKATAGIEKPMIGRRVVVYGAGNVAMDAARTAQRLGAEEAVIVFRWTRAEVTAHEEEFNDAVAEGVQTNWLRAITAGDGEDITVEIMESDGKGGAVGTGKFEKLSADTLILAIGQDAETGFLRKIPGLKFDNDVILVDPVTMMSDVPGIFAGGDAVPSARTVTTSVGHGKKAARQIDLWLNRARDARPEKHPMVHFDDLNLWYFGNNPRREQPALEIDDRMEGFEEVVKGLTPEQAIYEATRCLSCGNCIECDGCLGSCPEDAVIKLGKGKRYRYDYERCTGCQNCHDQCPVHAIVMVPEAA